MELVIILKTTQKSSKIKTFPIRYSWRKDFVFDYVNGKGICEKVKRFIRSADAVFA